MGHTGEEQWHVQREKLRSSISDYYKAKSIARKLQQELGIKNLHKVDPWTYKTSSLREMAQLLRRSMATISNDRALLGLEKHEVSGEKATAHESEILHNINIRYTSRVERKILSVEDTFAMMSDLISKVQGAKIIMPKYFNDLVIRKGIEISTGTVTLRTASANLARHYSGNMHTLNARELKASWLWQDNLRAFKVVAIPYKSSSHLPVIGYVVRSSVTEDVKPAFSTDITKAVSLCKRRVKSAVMKQMGL